MSATSIGIIRYEGSRAAREHFETFGWVAIIDSAPLRSIVTKGHEGTYVSFWSDEIRGLVIVNRARLLGTLTASRGATRLDAEVTS